MTPLVKKFLSPENFLYACGFALVLSGFFHTTVLLLLGGQWEGALSWRKPILFGFSTGLTSLSLGWIYTKTLHYRFDYWLCSLTGLSLVIEVALISLQTWRGQASHFNRTTAFNATIEYSMTFLIALATLSICEFTRRSFIKSSTTSDMRLAIRSGLILLVVSCLIGFVIYFHGLNQLSIQADPETIGRAGIAKFPHGIAIHSLQFFPVFCLLLRWLGTPTHSRRRFLQLLITSTVLLLLYSIVQTATGHRRWEPTGIGLVLLVVAIVPILLVLCELTISYFRNLQSH